MAVTVRNTINNDRTELPAVEAKTVHEAIQESGFIHGDFSARDKMGNVIDEQPISRFDGLIVDVGLPGRTVRGG